MSKKLQNATFKLLDILVILTMVLGSPMSVSASSMAQDSTPVLTADKPDYAPGETATFTGSGFTADGQYVLTASGPDGTAEWGEVTADNAGNFTAVSPELTSPGSYEVRANAPGNEALVASVSFTVTAPPDPTETPTEAPTATEPPTEEPTQEPTATEPPTEEPTATSTFEPTQEPTQEPTTTTEPTQEPTGTETTVPSATPTPSEPPTIASDYADYPPGGLVTLTGTNWQGDAEVRIIVNDDIGQSWRRDVTVMVASDGTISDSFNLPTHFVATYNVTARGQQTNRVATTTFTDSQEDYRHYADKTPANWQNGALQSSNSEYFEGEVVPHYWKSESLNVGQAYGFNIYYDYYDPSGAGFCGFDFMAQYNTSRTPPPVPPPSGSGVAPVLDNPIGSGPGNFYTRGADIQAVSSPNPFGVQRFVQVIFIATASKAEFYWGFHLAQPGAFSGCQGSKAWPGASLQTDVRNTPAFFPPNQMLGGGGSLQINPSAVIRGTISGFKWNDQDGDGVVDGTEPKLSGWTILLCADSGCTTVLQSTTTDASGNYNFNVAPGTYFVREVLQSGWGQTFPSSGFHGPLTVNASTPTHANKNFGNRANSITIVKDADPNDPQDFHFFGALGNFLLDDDSDPALPNSRTFSNLAPGGYTVGEAVPPGWTLAGVQCVGDNGNTVVPPGSNPILIILDPGENITCTFTNRRPLGTITIIKDAVPNDAQDFAFGGDLGGFSLDDDSDPSLSNTQTFMGRPPGTYRVFEGSIPAGWDLTSIQCNDPDGGTTSSGSQVNIDLDAGENITCTFTNTKRAHIIIDKVTDPSNDATSFSFSLASGPSNLNQNFSLTDSSAPHDSGPILPGSGYKVAETVPAGWDLTSAACSDGSPVTNINVSPGETVTCTFTNTLIAAPSLSINKTVTDVDGAGSSGSVDEAGDVISYQIVVNNTGNVALTGVTVSDPLLGTLSCAWPGTAGTLGVGQSVTCTGNYTATQADINGNGGGDGDIDNTATADSDQTGPSSDSEDVPVVQTSSLALDKTVTDVDGGGASGSVDEAGDVISYSILVTNTGNTTLTGVTVSDPLLGALSCTPTQPATLAPGASITCTGTYTATQSDLDGNGGGDGDIDNTATADSDQTGPSSDSEDVPIVQSPALSIDKTVTAVDLDTEAPFGVDAAGDVISYSILVTNTGNQTLTGVTVNDPRISNLICTWPGTAGTLGVGQSVTCTGSYTVTQGDIDSNGDGDGDIDNTATADSDLTGPATDSETVPLAQNPSLSIDKTVTDVDGVGSSGSVDEAGDVISYQIVVTNTGNQTLTGVTVTDPLLGTLNCTWPGTPGTLGVGQSVTCTGSYTVLLSDIDDNGGGDGDIDNTATTDSDQTDEQTDSEEVPIVQAPSLAIDKTVTDVDGEGSTGSADEAGDIISYSIVVTNTGNQTLTGVTVSDSLLGTLSCTPTQPATLAPGESITCTGSYSLTQGDIDTNGGGDGDIDNTATADSDQTGPSSDSEVVPVLQAPALTINKTVTDVDGEGPDGSVDAAGDVISYSILVTNTGNQTLTNVTVSDPLLITLSCIPTQPATLAPGETITCTGSYMATQSDIDDNGGGDGDIDNTATVDSDQTNEETDSEDVPIVQAPALKIDKTVTDVDGAGPSGSVDEAGDIISYSIVVTNTGNQTLTDVTVSDPLLGALSCTWPGTAGTLGVGESVTCTGSYAATQGDIDDNGGADGDINNTATADSDQTDEQADSEDVPIVQAPSLMIDKTVTDVDSEGPDGSVDAAGDVISYSILVTNTGNQTLTGVMVNDPLLGTLVCTPTQPATLAPGETMTCTGSYIVLQSDIDNNGGGDGDVDNTATTDSDQTEEETDSEDVPVVQAPALTINKTVTDVDGEGPEGSVDESGDVISYSILVTNTGNQTLTNVTVADPLLGTLSCTPTQPATLAPGETITCMGSYMATQGDIDDNGGGDGDIDNTATADSDQTEEETDSEDVPVIQAPALTINKTVTDVDGEGPDGSVDAAGDVITYQIVVMNTGNQTLTDVTVSDPLLGTLICTPTQPATLAPTESIICTGSYTVLQSDIDDNGGGDGDIDNTATVDSNQTEEETDSEDVPVVRSPALSLDKTGTFDAGLDGFADPGELITYTFVVTNTGNVTLTNVTVTDPLPGMSTITCDGTTIPVGGFITCTATYAVTQDDIDAGFVTNLATADSDESEPDDDDNTEPLPQDPALILEKTGTFDAGADGYADPGELIAYTFVVTNTGNVTLHGVTVTDPLPGLSAISCPATTLTVAPNAGSSMTCTASYAVTQADIDAGFVTNLATADSDESEEDTDENTEELPQNHALTVDKSANPSSLPEPGGAVTFTVIVNNTGNTTLNLTSLEDNVYGDIADDLNPDIVSTTCSVPQTILVNTFYECTFDANVTGEPGFYTDIVTATANDVPASDDATVEITDVLPTVNLTKDVTPATLPEPGGVFTFTLTITNDSVEDVTITALTDDNALSAECTALIGTTLAAGASTFCEYTVTHTDAGTYDNTASVTVADDEGNEDSESDSETVEVIDVTPVVDLVKDVTPASYPEPGGIFTYTLNITNNSVESVAITALTDDNALSAECLALIGTTLAPNQTVSCTYPVTHTDAGSYDNTANVTVADNEGNSASDSDNETVTVTDVLPTVTLDKSANPTSLTVGQSATFTLVITNTSVETVTVTALTDTNALSAQCLALVGTTLAAGASTSCTYTVTYSSPGSFTNTASVTVRDNENNPATDTDDATVTVNKASPTIVTTPNPTSGKLGVVLNDSASLSNGFNPTGTITFRLYDPSQPNCTGTPRFTQIVTVNGNGTYTTTGGFMTDRVGTWRWTATYSGDAKNNTAISGCNAELVQVSFHAGTIGFWKNWRNHYTSTQFQLLIDYLKTNNALVYNKPGYPLTTPIVDAIFNVGNKTPREQMILAQFTALKFNLAITQRAGTGGLVQKNDNICLAGTINVSGISGASALFGTSTPTIQQVVTYVESRWTGKLTTNRNDWKWNMTNAHKDIIIKVVTGINEGTLVTSSGCP